MYQTKSVSVFVPTKSRSPLPCAVRNKRVHGHIYVHVSHHTVCFTPHTWQLAATMERARGQRLLSPKTRSAKTSPQLVFWFSEPDP